MTENHICTEDCPTGCPDRPDDWMPDPGEDPTVEEAYIEENRKRGLPDDFRPGGGLAPR